MNHTLSDILSLSGEAALVVRKGKVIYANSCAQGLLGPCTGEAAAPLLGLDVHLTPARTYLADTMIEGSNYILRVNRLEEGRLVFLTRQEEAPVILNDAFLYNLRSNLMTLGVAADKLRPAAENLEEGGMLDDLTALTAGYYKLMRLSDNASFVRDMFEHRAAASPVELDFSLLCHALLDAVEDVFSEVHFARDIPGGIHMNADAGLIRQMFFNLLSNCLIHGRPSIITVRLSETHDSVVLAISDNGRGILPEMMHTVFDRYRHNFGPGMLSGAGLGLTAARGVTQLHGGTLLLESRTDQGTAIRASFSKRTPPGKLHSGEELCTMRDLLQGLADCLPLQFFNEKYLD